MVGTANFDAVIVGAGGGGLTAAAVLAESGRDVLVLEKLDRVGGNTRLSSGSIPGAGSRLQSARGIDDDAGRYEQDVLRQTDGRVDRGVLRALVEQSAPLVHWILDEVGLGLELITAYRHVGHSVPRLHVPASRSGSELIAALRRAAETRGAMLATGTPVHHLDRRPEGFELTVKVGGGTPEQVRAGVVLLAANGFGANREMIAEHCPEMLEALYFGAEGSTGEAIKWGQALDGQLANMGAYQGHGSVAVPHNLLLSWTAMEKGGILVDAHGKRFVDETRGYSRTARDVVNAAAPRWAIFDEQVAADMRATSPDYVELESMGGVRCAGDPISLAEACDADPSTLAESVAYFSDAAARRVADAFGRTEFGHAPLRGALSAVRVEPALFHTQGGLRVDEHARVLDSGDEPIPGLYAAGGVAAGISGDRGGEGYCSGSGLLSALGLGRIAALHALELQAT